MLSWFGLVLCFSFTKIVVKGMTKAEMILKVNRSGSPKTVALAILLALFHSYSSQRSEKQKKWGG